MPLEGEAHREISLEDQIASVEREIKMREKVYPRWVREKKIMPYTADHELAAMRAVLRTLLLVLEVGS